ncbi:MAG: UDP-glucose/GDP-mannose dehydrogenase family protein [Chlamydiota bacterium]
MRKILVFVYFFIFCTPFIVQAQSNILIVGTGYVGLVSGTCFAEMGHQVTCLDMDANKIEKLQNGLIPIYEPGLEALVKKNVEAKRLSFTTSYEKGIRGAQICFLAVPTPTGEDGSSDIHYLKVAARAIAMHMDKYLIIVNKSTTPAGTSEILRQEIKQVLASRGVSIPFDMAFNPEFLKEGFAVDDFLKPDRIVIGVDNSQVGSVLTDLYTIGGLIIPKKILVMDIPSAELIKYAANAMLALRISFMNELSVLCEKVGANIDLVRQGIGSDSRIGHSFLYAGMGYGGASFPKDVKGLIASSHKSQCSSQIIEAVERVNNQQKHILTQKMKTYFTKKGGLKGKKIGIWGLAFKPNTDDMSDAPSLVLIKDLIQAGAFIRVYDPVAMEKAQKILGLHSQIVWCKNPVDAAEGVDALALVTEWQIFKDVNLEEIKSKMQGKALFDGRNQYYPEIIAKMGFDYFSIGRQPALSSAIR